MITITRHIKINALAVFMFALCSVFHYPVIFYITYTVMFLHECAHMTAAVCIGLEIDYIAFQPFGVNLRLKNKIVPSIADEIILYISGPLVNAFAAFVCVLMYTRYGYYELRLFYMTNLTLFIVNLLPALPLDGGMILRRILNEIFGFKAALRVTRIVSAIICTALCILGVYAVIENPYNFSVFLFSLLLLGNIFTTKEKYDAELVRAQALKYVTSGM